MGGVEDETGLVDETNSYPVENNNKNYLLFFVFLIIITTFVPKSKHKVKEIR
jgi:hypothetical protein